MHVRNHTHVSCRGKQNRAFVLLHKAQSTKLRLHQTHSYERTRAHLISFLLCYFRVFLSLHERSQEVGHFLRHFLHHPAVRMRMRVRVRMRVSAHVCVCTSVARNGSGLPPITLSAFAGCCSDA